MNTFQQLKDFTWNHLSEDSPENLKTFQENARTSESVSEEHKSVNFFSPFIPEHLDLAMDLVDQANTIADQQVGQKGLENAMNFFQEQKGQVNPALLDHAMMVFMTGCDPAVM
jgi:hypothetical protein